MKVFVADSFGAMSQQAADAVVTFMQEREQPLICTASGDSPAGLYKEIVSKGGDIANWWFLGLDEWVGMNGEDEGSCRYHLDRQLFDPLKLSKERICFFNGRAEDLEAECDLTEEFIRDRGGIDVAILGIGMNGHIGMNEPGTARSSYSHVTQLEASTQQVGQKYFQKKQELTQGITLGIRTLLEATHIILLASGAHKAPIIQKIIEDEVSEKLPGSLLRNHPSLGIYLDAGAASQLFS